MVDLCFTIFHSDPATYWSIEAKNQEKGQKWGVRKNQDLEFSPQKFFAQIDFMLYLTHMEDI